jgi:hypothetical protein
MLRDITTDSIFLVEEACDAYLRQMAAKQETI